MTDDPAPFDITSFCAGRVVGSGVLEGPFGRLEKRFVCEIVGEWQGPLFVLRELLEHSDGTIDRREWRLTRHADGRFEGVADDVVGSLTGRAWGEEIRLRYVLKVRVKGWAIPIRFLDRFYRMPDGRVLNRATMYLLGLRVGELTFVLERA